MSELGRNVGIDFIFGTSDRAQRVTRCEVLDASPADEASDQFLVVAEFDLD
jgi:hypothetical protein